MLANGAQKSRGIIYPNQRLKERWDFKTFHCFLMPSSKKVPPLLQVGELTSSYPFGAAPGSSNYFFQRQHTQRYPSLHLVYLGGSRSRVGKVRWSTSPLPHIFAFLNLTSPTCRCPIVILGALLEQQRMSGMSDRTVELAHKLPIVRHQFAY